MLTVMIATGVTGFAAVVAAGLSFLGPKRWRPQARVQGIGAAIAFGLSVLGLAVSLASDHGGLVSEKLLDEIAIPWVGFTVVAWLVFPFKRGGWRYLVTPGVYVVVIAIAIYRFFAAL
jgi:hypothetical protein